MGPRSWISLFHSLLLPLEMMPRYPCAVIGPLAHGDREELRNLEGPIADERASRACRKHSGFSRLATRARYQRSHSRRCASSCRSHSALSFRAAFWASSFRRAISFLSSLTAASEVDRPVPGRLDSAIRNSRSSSLSVRPHENARARALSSGDFGLSLALCWRRVDTRSRPSLVNPGSAVDPHSKFS